MPFKTSTLQQVAVNKLNFASSKTMRIAQKLYEAIDLGSETVGLITYMRTDSERLSPTFINDTFKFIEEIVKKFPDKKNIGLIAQDYIDKDYSKYFISKNRDGYYSIDYSSITNALIKYTQELNRKVEKLEKEIQELKGGK